MYPAELLLFTNSINWHVVFASIGCPEVGIPVCISASIKSSNRCLCSLLNIASISGFLVCQTGTCLWEWSSWPSVYTADVISRKSGVQKELGGNQT